MVRVDQEICIGCSTCQSISPDVFDLNEEGKAFVKKQKKGKDVDDAIESCPVNCISK